MKCWPYVNACEAVAVTNALPMDIFALFKLPGGFVWIKVLKTFPTVSCIISQIPSVLTYVHMYPLVCLLCQNHSAFFNSQPVKPPPLSWQQGNGHRYLDNRDFSKLSTTCSDILLSILINSARSVTLSIYNSHNREFICSLSTSVCSHI